MSLPPEMLFERTLIGDVCAGVEGGSVVLNTEAQTYQAGAALAEFIGRRVTVRATVEPDVLTFAMQGVPITVHQVTDIGPAQSGELPKDH